MFFNSLFILTIFACSIAIDNFCMPYHDWKLLHALVQLLTWIYFVHSIVIYKFLNALSQLTTFVWPIATDNSYMHNCKNCFIKKFALIQITTVLRTAENNNLFVCTIAMDNFLWFEDFQFFPRMDRQTDGPIDQPINLSLEAPGP